MTAWGRCRCGAVIGTAYTINRGPPMCSVCAGYGPTPTDLVAAAVADRAAMEAELVDERTRADRMADVVRRFVLAALHRNVPGTDLIGSACQAVGDLELARNQPKEP